MFVSHRFGRGLGRGSSRGYLNIHCLKRKGRLPNKQDSARGKGIIEEGHKRGGQGLYRPTTTGVEDEEVKVSI